MNTTDDTKTATVLATETQENRGTITVDDTLAAPVVEEKLQSHKLVNRKHDVIDITACWCVWLIVVFMYSMALTLAVQLSRSGQGAFTGLIVMMMWFIFAFVGLFIFAAPCAFYTDDDTMAAQKKLPSHELPSGKGDIIGIWFVVVIIVFIYAMALIQALQLSKSRFGEIVGAAIWLMWFIYAFVGFFIFMFTAFAIAATFACATKLKTKKTDDLRDDASTDLQIVVAN